MTFFLKPRNPLTILSSTTISHRVSKVSSRSFRDFLVRKAIGPTHQNFAAGLRASGVFQEEAAEQPPRWEQITKSLPIKYKVHFDYDTERIAARVKFLSDTTCRDNERTVTHGILPDFLPSLGRVGARLETKDDAFMTEAVMHEAPWTEDFEPLNPSLHFRLTKPDNDLLWGFHYSIPEKFTLAREFLSPYLCPIGTDKRLTALFFVLEAKSSIGDVGVAKNQADHGAAAMLRNFDEMGRISGVPIKDLGVLSCIFTPSKCLLSYHWVSRDSNGMRQYHQKLVRNWNLATEFVAASQGVMNAIECVRVHLEPQLRLILRSLDETLKSLPIQPCTKQFRKRSRAQKHTAHEGVGKLI